MALNTDIRQIAREVFREELRQLDLARRTDVTPPTLAQAEPRAPAATPGTSQHEGAGARTRLDRRGKPGCRDIDLEAQLRRSLPAEVPVLACWKERGPWRAAMPLKERLRLDGDEVKAAPGTTTEGDPWEGPALLPASKDLGVVPP